MTIKYKHHCSQNIDLKVVLQEYQSVVDAEWKILYDKLDKIHQSGAKVVLSKLPIGDVATQYFADRYSFHFSLHRKHWSVLL